jgi:hypothetical protein
MCLLIGYQAKQDVLCNAKTWFKWHSSQKRKKQESGMNSLPTYMAMQRYSHKHQPHLDCSWENLLLPGYQMNMICYVRRKSGSRGTAARRVTKMNWG